MLLYLNEARLGTALAVGELACPRLVVFGAAGPVGYARERRIRLLDGQRTRLTPQRARCRQCRRTQMLLPAWAAPRRGVDIATIATGLAVRLRGHSHRDIGTELGVPADTVRGRLRRLTGRAGQLRCHALDQLVALNPLACGFEPTGSRLADALTTLATTVEAARCRLHGRPELVWPLLGQLGLSRGCGNPVEFAGLTPGERVVDVGCGGGIDSILAAARVGPTGRVSGIDFAPEMIDRARQNVTAAGVADRAARQVADLTATRLPTGGADVAFSNCVLNLCPERPPPTANPTGCYDPAGDGNSPTCCCITRCPQIQRAGWAGTGPAAWAGTIPITEYLAIVAEAGFTDVTEIGRHELTGDELAEMARCPGPDYTPHPPAEDITAVDGQVDSLKFTVHKPNSRYQLPSGRA